MKSLCAYTAVCEEDKIWIPQYLREIERMDLPFVVLCDRMNALSAAPFGAHPLNRGVIWRHPGSGEFNEQCKQPLIDRAIKTGADWVIPWDVDETWGRDAPTVLRDIANTTNADWVNACWINLWDDPQHYRADLNGHRDKMYRTRSGRWRFLSPIVNGPYLCDRYGRRARGNHVVRHDLVCVHHGMMTLQLRLEHKARWDRIYSRTYVEGNPYGFWDHCLDEVNHPAVVKEWDG